MVLGPASCPAEVYGTAVSALGNGKFSRLGSIFTPTPPLKFCPCSQPPTKSLPTIPKSSVPYVTKMDVDANFHNV